MKIEVRGIGRMETSHDRSRVAGVVSIPNGCCPGRPVMIRKHFIGENRKKKNPDLDPQPDTVHYSAQCSCGRFECWYTNEFPTIGEAIEAYLRDTIFSREVDVLAEEVRGHIPVLLDPGEGEV